MVGAPFFCDIDNTTSILLHSLSFFFNDTATTEIYTLSLHDALPISGGGQRPQHGGVQRDQQPGAGDRKSTRLNSSHPSSSYAVFCLKKKKTHTNTPRSQQKHKRQTQRPARSLPP